jgi:hypothetical protein
LPLKVVGIQETDLSEQVGQIEAQIAGLEAQQTAIGEQLVIAAEEETAITTLRDDGLIEESRLNNLKRERIRLVGEQGRLTQRSRCARGKCRASAAAGTGRR